MYTTISKYRKRVKTLISYTGDRGTDSSAFAFTTPKVIHTCYQWRGQELVEGSFQRTEM